MPRWVYWVEEPFVTNDFERISWDADPDETGRSGKQGGSLGEYLNYRGMVGGWELVQILDKQKKKFVWKRDTETDLEFELEDDERERSNTLDDGWRMPNPFEDE